MSGPSLRCQIDGSELWIVPSVHFRAAFAEEVNRICGRHRPEAVAVELGPETAGAVAGWLVELGVSPGRRVDLPCMLGLTKVNRRIRASAVEAARRLQQATGRELHEMSPDVLREALGYSAVSVLYLSPTDSIIEAARCALELQSPLFGVDLENTAERRRSDEMIEDPTAALGDVEGYAVRNAEGAEDQRDDEIDSRREFAMAARLKTLLARYKKVLFVCGLAHWRAIGRLLLDAGVRPAKVTPAAEAAAGDFRRVVVHPHLAIRYMDLFPEFVRIFQLHRPSASELQSGRVRDALPAASLFEDLIASAMRAHFGGEGPQEQLDRRLEDFEARDDFLRLLRNLCVVRQHRVPDLASTLTCAQGVMSPAFCKLLADTLMEFDWATPSRYQDLLVLCPAPGEAGGRQRAVYLNQEGKRSRYFYIDATQGRRGMQVSLPIPWDWEDEPKERSVRSSGENSNWFPIDYLATALSLHAIAVARAERTETRIQPFEGSLLDGVDIKSTLRARVRGESRLYVRDAPRLRRGGAGEEDGYPVAWLFRLGACEGASFEAYADRLERFAPFVADPSGLERARREFGDAMAMGVQYSQQAIDERLSLPGCRVVRHELAGWVSFYPSVFTVKQAAIWGEKTQWRRNPMFSHTSFSTSTFSALAGGHRSRWGIDVLGRDWWTTLLLLAIPYSAGALTVIAPDGFVMPEVVSREAARHGTRLRQLPLSFFPRDKVKTIATQILVPNQGRTAGDDQPIYPEHVGRLLGEKPDQYRRLVPAKWREYGNEPAENAT